MLADARGVDGACGGRRPTDPRGAGSFCRAQLAVGADGTRSGLVADARAATYVSGAQGYRTVPPMPPMPRVTLPPMPFLLAPPPSA